MLETFAMTRAGIDMDVGTYSSADVGQLVQHNLAGAGSDGHGLDDAGLLEPLPNGVASPARQVQAVVSRDRGGQ